jgi:hypothetical protein
MGAANQSGYKDSESKEVRTIMGKLMGAPRPPPRSWRWLGPASPAPHWPAGGTAPGAPGRRGAAITRPRASGAGGSRSGSLVTLRAPGATAGAAGFFPDTGGVVTGWTRGCVAPRPVRGRGVGLLGRGERTDLGGGWDAGVFVVTAIGCDVVPVADGEVPPVGQLAPHVVGEDALGGGAEPSRW